MSANARQPRPIEPGCLCLIVRATNRPELIGSQCTAIRLVLPGETVEIVNEGFYRINSPAWEVELPGYPLPAITLPENLRRIDGHRPEADELLETIPALQRINTRNQHNA